MKPLATFAVAAVLVAGGAGIGYTAKHTDTATPTTPTTSAADAMLRVGKIQDCVHYLQRSAPGQYMTTSGLQTAYVMCGTNY